MRQLPEYRVYLTGPLHMRLFGCIGCLVVIFVVGGMIGVLLFGWKFLLGQ